MNSKTFWDTLPKPIIALSPMDGVSDHPFRHIQKKYGNPALVYTEFTNVEGICRSGKANLLNQFLYDEIQRPIIAQIYGHTPPYFRQVATLLCEIGVDGIDINMGCPDKSVAKSGSGAGLIKYPQRAQEIVRETKAGVQDWLNGATVDDCPDIKPRVAARVKEWHQSLPEQYQQRRPIPVSVKTRMGYDDPVIEWWIPTLLEVEPVVIGIHGRTLKQGYSGKANWDEIGKAVEVAKGSKTLILGNGDIKSLGDAQARVKDYNVDGVLIGRASYGNPFVFKDELPLHEQRDRAISLLPIALEHSYLFEETFQQYEKYRFLPMRKHLTWYIRGIPGASHLRKKLVHTDSPQEVLAIMQEHISIAKMRLPEASVKSRPIQTLLSSLELTGMSS